jgi:hypothetical protein
MSDEVDDKPGDIKPQSPQNAKVVVHWGAISAVAGIVGAIFGVIPEIDKWVTGGVPSWLDKVLEFMVGLMAAVASFAGLRFAIRRNRDALAWQQITRLFSRINRRLKSLANVGILYLRTYARLVGLPSRKQFVIVVVALAVAVAIWWGGPFAVLQKPEVATDNRPKLPETAPSGGTPTPLNGSPQLTPQLDRLATGPETKPNPVSTPTPDAPPTGPETKPQPSADGSTPAPSNGASSIRGGVQGQGDASSGASKPLSETQPRQTTSPTRPHPAKDHPWVHRVRTARPGCGDPALSAAQQFSGGIPCEHMRRGADGSVYYNFSHQ